MRNKHWMLLLFLLLLLFIPCTAFASDVNMNITLKKHPRSVKKTVYVGDNFHLSFKYKGKKLKNGKATINLSKSGVVSVDSTGSVKALKTGRVLVTIRYRKRYAKILFKVKSASSSSTKTTALVLPADVIAITSENDLDDVLPIKDENEVSKTKSSSTTNSVRNRIVAYAKQFVGVLPYVWGGNSLTTGTDCSGFVHLIYDRFGYSVPRSAREFQALSNISKSELLPGDVIVYKNGGHVALYIGDGNVVHAKGRDYGTVVDKMSYGTPTGYVRFIK